MRAHRGITRAAIVATPLGSHGVPGGGVHRSAVLSVSGVDERFAEIDGVRLRYLIGGQGKPLVLCHGFLSSGEEFGGRFAALTSQRTLIAPDLPGNGKSGALASAHTAEAMAQSVHGLIQHLGIGRYDLAGLCLGASVACALAHLDGDPIDHLILHTPLLGSRLIRRQYRWQVRVLTTPPLWQAIVWLSRRRAVSDLYKRLLIEGDDVDRETSEVNFLNQRRADPRAAKEWLSDALRRRDLECVQARAGPTLIIVPQHDRLVNVERLRSLVQRLSDVDLVVDDLGGHGWSPEAVGRHLQVMRMALND
ncbi:MAG: alpha/beta hydrolase [Candidatus Dormiibacterota bacterium]